MTDKPQGNEYERALARGNRWEDWPLSTPPASQPAVTLDRETWVQGLAKRAQRCLGCQKVWITPAQLRDLCAAYQPNGLETLLIDVAQLLDGWHQDGTAWSAWDESVRQRVGEALALLRAADKPAAHEDGQE